MIETKVLQGSIFKILKSHPEGLSEYDLIQELKKTKQLPITKNDASLALFQHHFIVMHGLYKLLDHLRVDNTFNLSISPLNIKLSETASTQREAKNAEKSAVETSSTEGSSIEDNVNLREYYLDWNNFESTDENDVDGLLKQFWQDYAKYIQKDDAWEILDVPVGSDKAVIAKRYRELAAVHHPDKGGDQETFIKIRAAYEALK